MKNKSKFSNIDNVSYDKEKKETEVFITFQNRLTYKYQDVGLASFENDQIYVEGYWTYFFKNILKKFKGVKKKST